jgi:catechol 2,3-dioxygenase-like lactoylglutathione lyase family enzyme
VASGTPDGLHHVELWVPDLTRTEESWGWLLGRLGWQPYQHWEAGRSWRLGDTYLVFERSPALTATSHDRLRPGLNHVALHAGTRADVDDLVSVSAEHGWSALFADRYPYAGGPEHYAGYLVDRDGFEVELVATRA